MHDRGEANLVLQLTGFSNQWAEVRDDATILSRIELDPEFEDPRSCGYAAK
ncbi:hypothetical protein ACFFV7_14795 [Nonomuraea spiralis]|uniref:Uncharacterized protein n=1 Tax=Nonomuraea spiralis TaxID=46182 RepID=A0ABV5IEJ5_9ACTN|nr:hypothetical protein [Nonomuraea spiralis]GGT20260.1 hypothetical protein GCM10010176_075900 [Nonomuraea spiralis]